MSIIKLIFLCYSLFFWCPLQISTVCLQPLTFVCILLIILFCTVHRYKYSQTLSTVSHKKQRYRCRTPPPFSVSLQDAIIGRKHFVLLAITIPLHLCPALLQKDFRDRDFTSSNNRLLCCHNRETTLRNNPFL